MANITAGMVKELREMSGAGMMDCKKALTECDGNMDEALEFLRKSGQAKAQKKASRIAAEGLCAVKVDGKSAAVVEVNSETDFVAKNDEFKGFVENVVDQVVKGNYANMDEFMDSKWVADSSKTVSEALTDKVATIGEKLTIRRFEKVTVGDNGHVVSYIHGGGRIAVIVCAESAGSDDKIEEALSNIAMQVAAMNPSYISRKDISDEEIAKMREITIDSAINDPFSLPKPILQKLIDTAVSDKVWSDEDIAIYEEKKSNMNYLPNFLSDAAKTQLAELGMKDKDEIVGNKIFTGLVEGRISKQLKEISLLDQVYVRAEDGKQSVDAYLKEVGKATGADLVIDKFVRFETGEGIEKREENFAEEVAKQMGQ